MAKNDLITMINRLAEYQISQLQEQAEHFIHVNETLSDTRPAVCPCCHKDDTRFIRKGFSGRKQRYQCMECGKKFTYDTGKLTAHSHQSEDKWSVFIEDTLNKKSLDFCAEHISVCHTTAFYMRQKLLAFLEDSAKQGHMLDGIIEADETYVLESQKGKPVTHRKARKHGESAVSRGLSSELMCICVAADRDGDMTAHCVNRARPSAANIIDAIGNRVADESVFQCDGARAYNDLIEQKHCTPVRLVSHESYSKVYHLNTVNGLHSRLKKLFGIYHGVSSRYLNRYLAMFTTLETQETQPAAESTADCVRMALNKVHGFHPIRSLMSDGLLTI